MSFDALEDPIMRSYNDSAEGGNRAFKRVSGVVQEWGINAVLIQVEILERGVAPDFVSGRRNSRGRKVGQHGPTVGGVGLAFNPLGGGVEKFRHNWQCLVAPAV
jgi:hypothetical protein